MRTLDGLAYDFQQVGEYVYLTNDADFTVQARLAPYGTSSSAAVNVAAAANVAGDRVGYYVNSNQPLLINGTSAAVPVGGLTLPHGGTLLRSTSGYTVKSPTGEQLILEPRGSYLNITISVPDRTKPYRGLLGTWDGNANNDLVSRTGQTFTASITQTDLYGAYGDSWRVTSDESLFDYGSDQGTATFSDDTFPSHPLTAASLPTQQYNEAHAACTAAGVVGATELADCVLDVAATTTSDATTIASVAQAAASTILPPPVLVVKPSGYSQDFEGLADGKWTSTNMRMMPALDQVESTVVLGPFASAEAVGLTLTGLPSHSSITVAFDTQIVGPWNGASFELSGDTNGISVVTTFSNLLASQSFPDQLGIASHAAQSGALVAGAVDLGDGSTPRAIYHHSYSFSHSVSGIQLTFVAPTLPAGAVWTIDNVFVVTSNVGDPWNPKCTSNGSPLDDHNACTIDSCDPSTGVVHTPRPAGTSCSDGNLCNGVETCDAGGSCQGIAPTVDDHNPCTADSCDPQVGVIHTTLTAGTSCSDGNHCNGAETCNGTGQCQPGTPPDPASLPPDITCDGIDDDCDGTPDDNYVPTTTHCGVGACVTTGQLQCSGGSTHDTCAPLFAAAHDSLCDGIDDNCNGQTDEEYPASCAADGVNACVAGHVTLVSCDDHSACTIDGCSAGACTHVSTCDDHNPCTVDSCDAALGCSHSAAVGTGCNDADACTTNDRCAANGTCQGSPVAIDDNNPCTDDLCDPLAGVQHLVAVGRACDDGNACNLGDVCAASGACQASATRNCSDGLFCDGIEDCIPALGCISGTPPSVDDQIACTVDSCDEPSGSVLHQPNDALCVDSNLCNGAEHCDAALGCTGGVPLAPDDGNPCTIDTCDAIAGVGHSNAAPGTACGTNRYCDGSGQCLNFGQCATNLVVAAGQNLSFTGPCDINAITFNGGSLTINGALKTPSITMQSGGTLKVNAGALITGAISLSNGTIDIGGNITGSLAQTGGTFSSAGQWNPGAGFNLNTGTFTNTGTLTLPVFDASNLPKGTFNNRGRLEIGNITSTAALTVAANLTLNESGTIGATNTIGQLNVSGILLHDTGLAAGLAFTVTGDATIASTGKIDVSRRGLSTYTGPSGQGAGQGYVLNAQQQWVVTNGVGGTSTGGSHGGIGSAGFAGQVAGTANDAVIAPVLLGSGGGSNDTSNGFFGGNGGGRVDLVVNGKLTVAGSILANGGTGNSGCGGGSGGSIRLHVDQLLGAGTIGANGGTAAGNGGGGRVAIEYNTKTFTGAIQAAGAANSGAGTIYLKSSGSTLGELTVDNIAVASSATPLSPTDGPFAKVTVSGLGTLTAPSDLSSNWFATGGNLTLNGSNTGSNYTVSSGTLTLNGNVTPASIALSSTGTLANAGTLNLGATTLQQTGGTVNNTGLLSMPVFDSTTVHAGTFINRGRLDIASNILTVPSGVSMSESGSLGAGDSIGQLNVSGTLRHESSVSGGLSFTVTGDATIASAGKIDVSGRGLPGYTVINGSGAGTGYVWNGVSWVITNGVGNNTTGGSHGGVGSGLFGQVAGPINDTPAAPVLLGSGGGGSDPGNGNSGVPGGGRVDLVVNGKLRVDGSILANGSTGTSHAGAGSGGSIRLRLNRLEGVGAINASGGNADGCGGGGLVAVEYNTKTYTGTFQVAGGCAAAGSGVVTERNLTTSPITVTPLVRAGGATVCSLSSVGALPCAGNDGFGVVSQAPAGAYNRLAVGTNYACSLHPAGMAHCWGSVANGLYNEPVDAFSDIAVSRLAACAIRSSDGSLVCWGDDTDGVLTGKPTTGQFSAIYMAERTACAKRSDGTLGCWGDNSTLAVSQAPSTVVSSADGGDGFFCAVKSDAKLACWGNNSSGQTAAPSGSTYSSVTAGKRHACALDSSGTASCWGDNSVGEATPIANTYTSIAAGDDFSCGLLASGSLSCWGSTPAGL